MKLRVAHGDDFVEVEGDATFCAHVVTLFRECREKYYAAIERRRRVAALEQSDFEKRRKIHAHINALLELDPEIRIRRSN